MSWLHLKGRKAVHRLEKYSKSKGKLNRNFKRWPHHKAHIPGPGAERYLLSRESIMHSQYRPEGTGLLPILSLTFTVSYLPALIARNLPLVPGSFNPIYHGTCLHARAGNKVGKLWVYSTTEQTSVQMLICFNKYSVAASFVQVMSRLWYVWKSHSYFMFNGYFLTMARVPFYFFLRHAFCKKHQSYVKHNRTWLQLQ